MRYLKTKLVGKIYAMAEFCEFLSGHVLSIVPIDGRDFYAKRPFHNVKMDILHMQIAARW